MLLYVVFGLPKPVCSVAQDLLFYDNLLSKTVKHELYKLESNVFTTHIKNSFHSHYWPQTTSFISQMC